MHFLVTVGAGPGVQGLLGNEAAIRGVAIFRIVLTGLVALAELLLAADLAHCLAVGEQDFPVAHAGGGSRLGKRVESEECEAKQTSEI